MAINTTQSTSEIIAANTRTKRLRDEQALLNPTTPQVASPQVAGQTALPTSDLDIVSSNGTQLFSKGLQSIGNILTGRGAEHDRINQANLDAKTTNLQSAANAQAEKQNYDRNVAQQKVNYDKGQDAILNSIELARLNNTQTNSAQSRLVTQYEHDSKIKSDNRKESERLATEDAYASLPALALGDYGGNKSGYLNTVDNSIRGKVPEAERKSILAQAGEDFEAVRYMSEEEQVALSVAGQEVQASLSELVAQESEIMDGLYRKHKLNPNPPVSKGEVTDLIDSIGELEGNDWLTDTNAGYDIYGQVQDALGYAPNKDQFLQVFSAIQGTDPTDTTVQKAVEKVFPMEAKRVLAFQSELNKQTKGIKQERTRLNSIVPSQTKEYKANNLKRERARSKGENYTPSKPKQYNTGLSSVYLDSNVAKPTAVQKQANQLGIDVTGLSEDDALAEVFKAKLAIDRGNPLSSYEDTIRKSGEAPFKYR